MEGPLPPHINIYRLFTQSVSMFERKLLRSFSIAVVTLYRALQRAAFRLVFADEDLNLMRLASSTMNGVL